LLTGFYPSQLLSAYPQYKATLALNNGPTAVLNTLSQDQRISTYDHQGNTANLGKTHIQQVVTNLIKKILASWWTLCFSRADL